jgi:pyrimidine-nucleoside phosphorylase
MEMSRKAIESGCAWQKWLELVSAQGGDVSYLKKPERYETAQHEFDIKAVQEGCVNKIDAYAVGMASLELGAGRKIKEEQIDPVAGIVLKKKIGDPVKKDETIAVGFTNKYSMIEVATGLVRDAFSIGKETPEPVQMVTYKVDRTGMYHLKGKG